MESINSYAKLKGFIRVEKISANGEIEVRENTNTIMNVGKAEVAGLILNDIAGVTKFDYVAIGTSSTAPAATQTALGGEAYRVAATGTRATTTVTNDTAKLSGSFAITATATLREMGVFNSSSTGIMLARATFSDLAVNNGDTVNAVYNVQFS